MGNILFDWSRLEGLELPRTGRSRRAVRYGPVAAGETMVLCDLQSAGCINHVWMTITEENYRGLILRMTWDDEDDPSVEAPLTDFFGVGHNMREIPISSPALVVAPHNGYNIYLPMPFGKRALITLTNENETPVGEVYFQADYAEFEAIPDCPMRFHAQWRRDNPAPRRGRTHGIIEAAGWGYVAGLTYHLRVRDAADAWFHGGGDTITIDGGTPQGDVIHGIGGEDFFGASWGIKGFGGPYCGCSEVPGDSGEGLSMYRFFGEGPVGFEDNVRVGFGVMGNDVSSVGYWYQTEPHQRFWRLPPVELRGPESDLSAADHDVAVLGSQQGIWAVLGPFAGGIGDKYAVEEAALRPRGVSTADPESWETDYPGPFGDVAPETPALARWKVARTDLWWVDVNALLVPKYVGPTCVQMIRGVAYMVGRVRSTRDWRARLLVSYDDDLQVWLDGRQVHKGHHGNGYASESIPIELRRGMNTFLVKTTNQENTTWGAWCVSLRIMQNDGTPADNVVYEEP